MSIDGADTEIVEKPPAQHRVLGAVRRVPFTLCGLALIIVGGFVFESFWRPLNESQWWDRFAYGLPALEDGRWWTPITGSFFATEPAQYVPVLLSFGLMVGFCEWRLGTRVAALAAICGQLFAVVAAAALLAIFDHTAWSWADATARELDVGASAAAMCSIVVAAFSLAAPWRGRVLVVVLGYCVLNLVWVGVLWDLEHMLAALLGLFIGSRVTHSPLRFRRMTRHESRVIAATLFVMIAIANLLAFLYPDHGPLGPAHEAASHPVQVIVGVLLELLLATGLHRGSRLAWRLAVVVAALGAVGAVLQLQPARSIAMLIMFGALLILLIRTRDAYTAEVEPPKASRLIRDAVIIVLASIAYVIIGFAAIDDFRPEPTRSQALRETVARTFLGSTDEFVGTSRPARAFLDSLSFIPLTVVLLFLLMLLIRTRRPQSAIDRERVIELLKTYGGSNISWMTTWPRNVYFVTADDQAVVTYQVHAGAAIVLGDPIGAPASRARALIEFARFCDERGYLPCVFSCTDEALPQADELRWQHVQIAEDTIVDLPELEFVGRNWQAVRTAMNRAAKSNVSFSMGPLREQPFSVVQQARGISEQWVSDKAMPEMGFTLGGIDEALDPEVQVGIAMDENGRMQGITSWLPVFGPDGTVTGWTLDVMRRHPEGEFRPVMEFMIASSALAFKDAGALTASLSGAPLARADADAEIAGMESLLNSLGELMEPLYGFRSLHQFKAKFRPRYEPMYLCYPDEAALPRIGIAITRAYLPDATLRDFAAMLAPSSSPAAPDNPQS